jgi:type VII secretion protein EccB
VRSRRDHVHAHTYMVGRLTSALIHAEPDAPETPTRRTLLGCFGGLVLGALAVAGFMVWGLLFGGASTASSLAPGTLVEAQQTGSRYILLNGALRPVLNWASARLLLGGLPKIQALSQAVLDAIPQGQPLGILGAPDTLPAAVNQGAWLACSGPSAGRSGPLVTLAIGVPVMGSLVPGNDALLVAGPGGVRYLLWQGHRLRIDATWIPAALGFGGAQVTQVGPGWLNAVPAGPDLGPLAVSGLGSPGPAVGGRPTRAGQVLVIHNVGSPDSFYLAETNGVAAVTPVQAALALADPAAASAYEGATIAPVPVTPAAIAAAPVRHQALPDGAGDPSAPPTTIAPAAGQGPCIYYPRGTGARPGSVGVPRGGTGESPGGGGSPLSDAGASAAALVLATPPSGAPPGAAALDVTLTPEVADRITVAAGGGALVRPQPAPGVTGQSLFLVTSTGVKYAVPTASAAAALGYPASTAETLPASLLALLPTGPALNLAPLQTAGQAAAGTGG